MLRLQLSYGFLHAGSPLTINPASPPRFTVAFARRNIVMIEGKFSTLVTMSCEKFQSRNISFGAVQTFLITMYSSPNSRDGNDTVTSVVESAESMEEIFRALSKYRLWDYLNYFLLQSMIEQFARDDRELNDMMQKYQQDLTGHTLVLKIQTYLDATHPVTSSDSENSDNESVPAPPPQDKCWLFQELSVKVDINVTEHSLSYVDELWRSLANQFLLPQSALILDSIAKGCISITWLIPANLVNYVSRIAQATSSKFEEKHVLKVVLEDQCIYSMENKPTVQETEAAALKKKVCFVVSSLCFVCLVTVSHSD